jgi:uncharacterized protein involved in response to NO
MSFPACRHAKKKTRTVAGPLTWLGSEPYRLFFLSGTLFSIAGVLLWPMFYRGQLGYYPNVSHARVMIECFGGAFVIGFLGTAGPRMLGAPRLKPWELVLFFTLHVAGGAYHLLGKNRIGDLLFLALLGGFAVSLAARFALFRREMPPPPLLLAAVGVLCGIAGTLLWANPKWMTTTEVYRLAGLLLYQGFLLAPVMGVGIFMFPRLLGHPFGEPEPGAETRKSWRNMGIAAGLLVASFGLEVWWNPQAGYLVRFAALVFALAHVKWRRGAGLEKAGTLANALRIWCLPLAAAGLLGPVFYLTKRIAMDHLLFVGGFGLLCLIVASRVIFGHSGKVERFSNRSWTARWIVFAVVLAALTRLSADFMPASMISHYEYAAWSWAAGALLWTAWHAPRFFKKDDD